MKKIIWIVLVTLYATMSSAWARLGETEDQLIQRYGKELQAKDLSASADGVPLRWLTFSKQNWLIYVYLYKGVSAREELSKQNGSITKEGIATLLDNFSQGHRWQYLGFDIGKGDRWLRDDGCTVTSDRGSSLHFYSKQLLDALEAAHQTALHPNMKGF